MADEGLLAGGASLAALLGGLLSDTQRRGIWWGVGCFVLIFLYSAVVGAAFPMGIAHLIAASFLGLVGHEIRQGIYQEKMGRIAWRISTALLAVLITAGMTISLVVEIGRGFPERQGLLAAVDQYQGQGLEHARAMMRGQAELPKFTQGRALLDSLVRTTAETFFASPIKYVGNITGFVVSGDPYSSPIFRTGRLVAEFLKDQFPGDPARRYEFSHMFVQGFSTSAGWHAD
jgi:hypothetical protein